ncbi:MAG TPA: peptidoglycan hydrolase FlgJ [Rheinheimera sp.]|nr:peptidoglycan hydrolase FlgJ [Rheinheimera sp.]
MASPDLNVSYHDLNSLNELRSIAKTDQEQAIRQAAKQFESVFMGMLLSSMRKANANFEEDNPMNSQTTGFYRDMYDSQLSAELSKSGTLGLADLMVQQLAPQLNKRSNSDLSASLHKHSLKPEQTGMALPQEQQGKALPSKERSVTKLDTEHLLYSKKLHSQPTSPQVHQLAPEQVVKPQAVPLSSTSSSQYLPAEQWVTAKNGRLHLKPVGAAADTQDKPRAAATTQLAAAESSAIGELSGSSSQQAFIKKLLPAAQKAAALLGLEPVALIAQAALETGWGSKLSADASSGSGFNLFGIKAQPGWQGATMQAQTMEYRQGVMQTEQATFRAYNNVEQSMQDYVEFIQQNPRYKNALAVTAEPAAYFRQLQAAGYATDPNYARKVMAVMQSPVLQQLKAQLQSSSS